MTSIDSREAPWGALVWPPGATGTEIRMDDGSFPRWPLITSSILTGASMLSYGIPQLSYLRWTGQNIQKGPAPSCLFGRMPLPSSCCSGFAIVPTERKKNSKALGYGLVHGSRGPYFLERMLTIDRIVHDAARLGLRKHKAQRGSGRVKVGGPVGTPASWVSRAPWLWFHIPKTAVDGKAYSKLSGIFIFLGEFTWSSANLSMV